MAVMVFYQVEYGAVKHYNISLLFDNYITNACNSLCVNVSVVLSDWPLWKNCAEFYLMCTCLVASDASVKYHSQSLKVLMPEGRLYYQR